MKAINDAAANEFHVWQRNTLGQAFTLVDVDAWAVSISDPHDEYRPVALYELKRSHIPPADWRPYAADRPSYTALYRLASAASIPFFVVYFTKGQPIQPDSPLAVFYMTATTPEYRGQRRVMTADEFRLRFREHPTHLVNSLR